MLRQHLLAGIAMPVSLSPAKINSFLVVFIFLVLGNTAFAQENYFENIDITPSTCDEDNGTISLDSPPHYIDFGWDDGVDSLNRNNLAPGVYTLSGTDEEGCIETLVLEVPGISDCDFEFITWQVPVNPSDNSDGPTDGGPVRPCVIVGFDFTLNGQVVPTEHLVVTWVITTPTNYPPYSESHISQEPIVPVYTAGTRLDILVFLNTEEGAIPCCTFTDKITINDPCKSTQPPKVFVHKSTFSDAANYNNVPGLIELLVYGDGSCGGTTDLRGYILDDNNGELIPPQDSNLVDGQSLNVDPGYIRFADVANWAAVPNGSIISVYEPGHSQNLMLMAAEDPMDVNQDFHYVLGLENSLYFEGYNSTWDFDKQVNTYDGSSVNPSWSLIKADGGADAVHVRYPDGAYCHGFSYGKTTTSTETNWFALHIADTEHAFCQIHMNRLSYLNKTAFEIIPVTGGFSIGQVSDSIAMILDQLRDCNNQFLFSPPEDDKPLDVQTASAINISPEEDINKNSSLLEVYPNPFQQFLQINYQSETTGTGNIQIYDSQGKTVKNISVECTGALQNLSVDFGNHNSGLFFIRFQSPDAHFISKKAVLIDVD